MRNRGIRNGGAQHAEWRHAEWRNLAREWKHTEWRDYKDRPNRVWGMGHQDVTVFGNEEMDKEVLAVRPEHRAEGATISSSICTLHISSPSMCVDYKQHRLPKTW